MAITAAIRVNIGIIVIAITVIATTATGSVAPITRGRTVRAHRVRRIALGHRVRQSARGHPPIQNVHVNPAKSAAQRVTTIHAPISGRTDSGFRHINLLQQQPEISIDFGLLFWVSD